MTLLCGSRENRIGGSTLTSLPTDHARRFTQLQPSAPLAWRLPDCQNLVRSVGQAVA